MTTSAIIRTLARLRPAAAGCAVALVMAGAAGAQPAPGVVYADEVAGRVCAIRCVHLAPPAAATMLQPAPPAPPPTADDLRDMAFERLSPPPLFVRAAVSVEPVIPHAVIWQRRDRPHRIR